MRSSLTLALLLLVSACHNDTDEEPTADSGAGSENHGGDHDPCVSLEAEAIAWDATSEVGSPADVFGAAEARCEAELSWDGVAFDRRIEPLNGHSTVTVELVLDHDSARWTAREAREIDRLEEPCGGYMEVDGNVTLHTQDGTFHAQSAVTLHSSADERVLVYGFQQAIAEHAGSLSIELVEGERGSLIYEIDGSGTACAGSILLSVSSSSNGVGMTGGGPIAQWSDSACPLGEAPFDLIEPGPDGVALADAIEEAWSDATFSGEWLDGEEADLVLHIDVLDEVACREIDAARAVLVPVRATYSTSDGRLRERTVDASVRVALDDEGSVRTLQFWLSDDQVCADEDDTLEYEPADCAEVEMVTLQLGINQDTDGELSFSDDGLNVFLAPRDGVEPPPLERLTL